MSIEAIIGVAALLSAIFRVIPCFLTKFSIGKHQKLLDFLDYAGCAAIGSMIYMTAFSHLDQVSSLVNQTALLRVNALILIVAFLLSLKLKKPVITFIICIITYALIVFLLFHSD